MKFINPGFISLVMISSIICGCSDSSDNSSEPCSGVNCSGNGICIVQYDMAVCSCFYGYHSEGLNCIRDPLPCDDVSCSGHGTCVNDGEGNLSCDCDEGYVQQGLDCIAENDPCLGVTCSGHGTCVDDGEGNPACDCDEGYTASGLNCRLDGNPCGNGVLDPGEECDGANLGGETCATVSTSKPSGVLACGPTCFFDLSGCTTPFCGNGLREGIEECDGTDLGGFDCLDIAGFDGGVLGCSSTCDLDISGCVASAGPCTLDSIFYDSPQTCQTGFICGINYQMQPACMPEENFAGGTFYSACGADGECPKGSGCFVVDSGGNCLPYCSSTHPTCPDGGACMYSVQGTSDFQLCGQTDNCDPVSGTGCTTVGEGCYLVDFDGNGVCTTAGTGATGSSCSSLTQCLPGNICADAGQGIRCIKLCATTGDCASGTCQHIGQNGLPPGTGICL